MLESGSISECNADCAPLKADAQSKCHRIWIIGLYIHRPFRSLAAVSSLDAERNHCCPRFSGIDLSVVQTQKHSSAVAALGGGRLEGHGLDGVRGAVRIGS